MLTLNFFKRPVSSFSVMLIFFVFFFAGCGDSEDEPSSASIDLVGSWYGTHFYNNPVGGIKYQYLTVKLKADGTGSLEYEAQNSMSLAYFKWSRSGNYVDCRGAYGSSSGDADGDFSLRLLIDGERLRPQAQFSMFILGKGTPVITDGDGKEQEDPDDQLYRLQNVWKSTDGNTVVKFYPGNDYDEYVLTEPFGKQYKSLSSGTYQFFPLQKQLTINTTLFDILEFSKNRLVLKHGSKTFSYTLGTESDIPSAPSLKDYLTEASNWVDKNYKYMFAFEPDGTVDYMEAYRYSNAIAMRAKGSFTVSGNTVTCHYTDVFWDNGTTTAKDYFPGWTCGKPCTKTYKVEITATGELYVELPNGSHVYLSNFLD